MKVSLLAKDRLLVGSSPETYCPKCVRSGYSRSSGTLGTS